MSVGLIEYADASPRVRAVYDDIMATRKTDWVNNFWKGLARDPATLERIWSNIKQVMAAGALDPLTKELIYIAVSVTNNCRYCIASHGASTFQKLLTQSVLRVAMMSSYTARTRGEASAYSINPTLMAGSPRQRIHRQSRAPSTRPPFHRAPP